MAGTEAYSAQPLLPPDQADAQPGQPIPQVQAPQNGPQNGGDPLANQPNDQARRQAMVNAPFQGISQPAKNAAHIPSSSNWLHLGLRAAIFECLWSWLNKLARAPRPKEDDGRLDNLIHG
jgi:hypothetical protein